jgi:CRP-like cAMP-binding protein
MPAFGNPGGVSVIWKIRDEQTQTLRRKHTVFFTIAVNAMSEAYTLHQNHLLEAFPVDVRKRLFPHLKLESLPLGKVLHESGFALHQVYFPIASIVSLQYVMESGASVEVSMVGNEGLVGIASLLGGGSTTSRALVQSAGHAYSLSPQRLRKEFNNNREVETLLLRYIQSLLTNMAQTAICNRYHSISQQLCRWLLLSLDRLPGNRLNMTQELIANLLGVRREGVTQSACKLQGLGVIEYKRGHITVLDRSKLEQLCCECYAAAKNETDRLEACRPMSEVS